MRGKMKFAAMSLLAIVGLSTLSGCIVAPGPGYYDRPYHRHWDGGGYYQDRGYWR